MDYDNTTKITNTESGTNITQVAKGIYRISTPTAVMPGGFLFNQYLILDNEPLLFHAGLKQMFPLVKQAVETIIPVKDLKYIAWSHFESDECGSLNNWLEVAPNATPLSSQTGAMVTNNDFSNKPVRGLAHGEKLSLGTHTVQWVDVPHLPHGWDTGYLFDVTRETLFAGDILTQVGSNRPPVVTGAEGITELLGSHFNEGAYCVSEQAYNQLETKLAALNPKVVTNMHGSCFHGDGTALLRKIHEHLVNTTLKK